MRAAVVDDVTNIVINIIIADASKDPAPFGTYLINIPAGTACDIGWYWDGTNFIPPNDAA